MKSKAVLFKRIFAAAFSAALLMGMVPFQPLTKTGGGIAPTVYAEGEGIELEEGELPLIGGGGGNDPFVPTTAKPDPEINYSKDTDGYVIKNYELPFVPTGPTSSGSLTGGSWSFYRSSSSYLTFSGTSIPSNAIASIYAASPAAITASGYYRFSNLTTINDNAMALDQVSLTNDDLAVTRFYFTVVSPAYGTSDGSLTTIGSRAFAGYTSISDLEFPMSLQAIGSEAFCNLNANVTFRGNTAIDFGADAFAALDSDKVVRIPYQSTYNGEVIVPDANGQFPAVFGEATVQVKDEYDIIEEKEPTCTAKGNIEFYVGPNNKLYEKNSDGSYSTIGSNSSVYIDKNGHDAYRSDIYHWYKYYNSSNANPETDTPDSLQCKVVYLCENCDDVVRKETVGTSTIRVEQSCTTPQKTIYYYDFTDSNGETMRTIRQLQTGGDALGHEFGEPTYAWAEDNSTVTATRVCTRDTSHVETETVTTDVVDNESARTLTYTAVFENEVFEDQTKTVNYPLVNQMTISDTALVLGNSAIITGNAQDGYPPYSYSVEYKRSTDLAWQTGVALTTDTELTFTPDEPGKYALRLTVKDSKHKAAYEYATLTVASDEALANNMTVSTTTPTIGDDVTVTCAAKGGYGDYVYAVQYYDAAVEGNDKWVPANPELVSTDTLTFTPTALGKVSLRLVVKDGKNKAAYDYATLNVKPLELVNEMTMSAPGENGYLVNEPITINCAAQGGYGDYVYTVQYYDAAIEDNDKWVQADTEVVDENTLTFTPETFGQYRLRLTVKDSHRQAKYSYSNIIVKSQPLVNNMTVDRTAINLGQSFNIACAAEGGTGNYVYAVQYKVNGNWTPANPELVSNDTLTFTPVTTGTIDIRLAVKDATARGLRPAYKYVKLTVMQNDSELSSDTIVLGDSVTVSCSTEGGTAPYHYALEYKRSGDTKWQTAVALTTDTELTFTPEAAGNYTLRVTTKDAKNKATYAYPKLKVTDNV